MCARIFVSFFFEDNFLFFVFQKFLKIKNIFATLCEKMGERERESETHKKIIFFFQIKIFYYNGKSQEKKTLFYVCIIIIVFVSKNEK